MALATLLHRLRPISLEEQHAQREYRANVERMASKLQALLDDWLMLREQVSDNGELANAAAVNRWELMRLVKSAEHLEPPRSLASLHREVHNALIGAARACQLLANGYRGHKSEAVCDGQALLIETVAELSALLDQLTIRA